MQKRLQRKTNAWCDSFKERIKGKMLDSSSSLTSENSELLQFIYDYPNICLTKEDFQKRKRVKNSVPYCDRCRALKAEGVQCTRRRKENEQFCGTHLKGTPHGIVDQTNTQKNQFKKIQVWAQEIDGIIYHLDDSGNIYDPQDIHENLDNPKIIAKYKKNEDGKCVLLK